MKYGVTLAAVPGSAMRAEYAKKAQAAGFDSAWSDDNPASDGLVHMSAMAAAAPNIRVGSGILRAFLRNPVTIASSYMTMNTLSQRGLILGIATGTRLQNKYQYGIDVPRPIHRLRSVIGMVRGFWEACRSGESFGWDDEYCQIRSVRSVPADSSSTRPVPIWIAAVNENMQRLAGELADGLCGHPVVGADYLREVVRPNIEAGRAKSGYDAPFEMACWATTVVDDDKERARHFAGQRIAFYLSTKSYQHILRYYGIGDRYEAIRKAVLKDRDMDAASRLIGTEVIDRIAVTGPPDEVREELTKRYAGVVDQVVVASAGPSGDTLEERLRTIDTVVQAPLE
jgi:alkanesulfonate monooxygenase SsuD/methylene tetrahydromethanopterin reductase-like flavin-dependent oxidoreductase (luciferase family)